MGDARMKRKKFSWSDNSEGDVRTMLARKVGPLTFLLLKLLLNFSLAFSFSFSNSSLKMRED